MDRHRTSSQLSIDRKSGSLRKETSAAHLNRQIQLQNDIDNLILQGILGPIVEYDPKLSFTYVPIVTRDQVLKRIRRQTSGLIWNSIRSPELSQLVPDGRACALVEILRTPSNWSRYDIDCLLIKIRQKTFLNGLALRDEFVRILHIIIKRNFGGGEETTTNNNENKQQFSYDFKNFDFTRNTIELVFTGRSDSDVSNVTLIVSLVLLLEFDVDAMKFFPETFTALCHHESFRDYLTQHPDLHRTRLTPFNSIKFLFDYSLTEANLCEYILQKTNETHHPIASMLTSLLKMRKEWTKYLPRATKLAGDMMRMQQVQVDKRRQSACSVNSIRSTTSTASNVHKFNPGKNPLTTEVELAFECLFSVPLLRLLFLKICSMHKHFSTDHEHAIGFATEQALILFDKALHKNYLEHPFLYGANVLPDAWLTYEHVIKIAIEKLIKEMQREWKRNLRR